MNRCPISYGYCGDSLYSDEGLRLLSPSLKQLDILDYSSEQLRVEAMRRASKMSIQGVQPKLSAVLSIKNNRFEIVSSNGKYILKPQHHLFYELPENEDLTMRLAKVIGIETPLHGLIWSKDKSLTYFIKRFDRKGQKDKLPLEDFAQLAGLSRETKYNYSMERLVKIIDDFCSFPAIEKEKLFRIVLFNFLVGNEDMHLKNFSVIIKNGKVELSPAYDLINTTIVLKGEIEEIALSIKGKKSNLRKSDLIDYFGYERCLIPKVVVDKVIEKIKASIPIWHKMIADSFLSVKMKVNYKALVNKRLDTLFQ